MADSIKVSALMESTDQEMTDGGLVLNSIEDAGSSTGYASRKTPLSRLANYVLNKFASLSLAGAAQTVKAAIDAVFNTVENVKTNSYMELGTTIAKNTNINTIIDVGKYSSTSATAATLTNCPTTVGFSMYVELFTSAGKKQTIIDNNGYTYTRINISNNTTSWTAWTTFGPMNRLINGTITGGTTLTESNLTAGMYLIFTSRSNNTSVAFDTVHLCTVGNSNSHFKAILSATNITVAVSAKTISVTNNGASDCAIIGYRI